MGGENGYQKALVKAYDLLARRACTAREIRQKLLRAGAEEEDVDRVLELLQARHFIDDAKVACEGVEALSERKGWGREKIRQWLRQRGVEDEVAAEALGGLDPEDEAAQAARLAEQQRGRGRSPQQIFRFLMSRGYRSSVAREAALGDAPGQD